MQHHSVPPPRGPAGKPDNDKHRRCHCVTILHSDNVSPEEKLLEIIEASGEAEVLDADDAQPSLRRFRMRFTCRTNDNSIATVRQ